MLKLQLIIGSTREGRNADSVCRWLVPLVQTRDDFETEILDLRDWPLPMFQETITTVGDFKKLTRISSSRLSTTTAFQPS
jgi:NAD(P)H-dependent FMN reductase